MSESSPDANHAKDTNHARGAEGAGTATGTDAAVRGVQRSKRRPLTVLIGALLLAGIDLGIKAGMEALLMDGRAIDAGLVNLRLFYNMGVAFSLGTNLPPLVVIAFTGAIIAGLMWFLLGSANTFSRTGRIGGTLLLGGALGNFIDRTVGNGVVDYLHSGWFPTFNLADVFVTTGVGLIIIGTLLIKPPHASVGIKE
ncbi:signal peptidase II [Arthrobacter agilis]|uniref:signal peptidase II n=1 Tax=Arthrobacter agilis TaxID=37921 RepID=UPI0030822675